MATAAQLLTIAAGHLGVTEKPPGSNCQPFSKGLGRPCEAWCADFVVSCLREAGVKIPSESAYTPTMFAGFRAAGMSVSIEAIQPGDVLFIDFPDKETGIQHTCFAQTAPGPVGVGTYEGNTSSGEKGSQDNGGGSFPRVRPLRYVVGVGRPPYSSQAPVPLAPPTPPAKPPAAVIGPLEVDVNLRSISLIIPLDDAGKGWTTVPYTIDRILGPLTHSGTRPGADGRYDGTPDSVGFSPEDDHTVVVVQGGQPHGSAPVWLHVIE